MMKQKFLMVWKILKLKKKHLNFLIQKVKKVYQTKHQRLKETDNLEEDDLEIPAFLRRQKN